MKLSIFSYLLTVLSVFSTFEAYGQISAKNSSPDLVIESTNSAESLNSIAKYEAHLTSGELSQREQSTVHGALGLLQSAAGNRSVARSHLTKSVDLAEAMGADDLASKSRFNLAMLELSGLGREVVPTNWFAATRSGDAKREVYAWCAPRKVVHYLS